MLIGFAPYKGGFREYATQKGTRINYCSMQTSSAEANATAPCTILSAGG